LAQWVDEDLADEVVSQPTGDGGVANTSSLTPELRTLAESLLRLIGPTAETAVQTGGVKDAGRVVRGGNVGRLPKAQDTGAIVKRVRISYSALRAARVDGALRQLLLSELLTQTYNEGGSVVVPQGMRFQPLPPSEFTKYKETLSGLNSDNAHLVSQKLIELGLMPGAGVGLPGDVVMKSDPEVKRLRN
jgi:hypothetical protein